MLSADVSPTTSDSSTVDASPYGASPGSPTSASKSAAWKKSVPPDHLQASLEDALAQLDVARQQRTEVSAQLFKFRCAVDELREQKAQLQSELNRRLQTHKEDVDRIMALQDECDSMRRTYNDKQAEIIELSTKIQGLMSKLESTEQYHELKEENELLWRRIEDLKKYEALEAAGELGGKESKWKERFAAVENALNEALESRRSMIGDFKVEGGDLDAPICMLKAILEAEERMRRAVSSQLGSLRMELRSAKDSLQEMGKKAAEADVASVKLDIETKKLLEAQKKATEMERERDAIGARLAGAQAEGDAARAELAEARVKVAQMQNTLTHVTAERDSLIRDQVSNAEVENMRRERAELRVALEEARRAKDEQRRVLEDSESHLGTLLSELHRKEAELQQETETRADRENTVVFLRTAVEMEKAATRRAEAEVERLESRLRAAELEGDATRAQRLEWETARKRLENELQQLRRQGDTVPAADLERRRQQADRLAADLKHKDAELQRLNQKLNELNSFIDSEREDFKERNDEWYATEAKLENQISELKRSQSETRNKAKQEANELRERLKATEARLQTTETQLQGLQATETQQQEEIQNQKREISVLRRHLAHQEETQCISETPETLARAEAAETQVATLETELAQAQHQLQELTQRFESQREQVREFETKVAEGHENEETLAQMNLKIKELESELERQRIQIAQLTEANQALETTLKETNNEHACTLEDLKQRLKATQMRADCVQTELDQVKEASEQEKQKKLALSAQIQSLEAQIEGNLSANLKSLVADSLKELTPQEQIVRLKMCLNRLSSEVKEKEALILVHESRWKEYEEQNKALQAQIKKVEDGWKQEYEGYVTHLSRVTSTLDRVNAEKTELQEQLNSKKALMAVASPGGKRIRSTGKLQLDTENSSTASSPSNSKEREQLIKDKKTLEKSLEALRRKFADLQREHDQMVSRKLRRKNVLEDEEVPKKGANGE
eukprot:Gregarina_sp_Poly_1__2109@NODE_1559_length_3848_cov_652_741338_g140_i1_p1_GENE_NODE_1559_length_3848_cov_652_741338_g140_i1NODE_1559_length_3848_cov_652_741338_g140_i1_p1_ORF_typecomplete_len978_score256_60Filament/PF00038_21/0_094Filament/PF00038_21/1_6Filament/PF00038_21/0_00028Filament/PF00038_21/3_4Filament/PF00038_21/0_051Filament/PF00038_21/0_17Filament/PF00038_21/45Myosin_tail_1/PF01576_19/0_27Myosin_tail_1/PF01576_19/1e05Myosin_tail_1/PF01576_19/0_005Myosin_tail_1/PF01576_19/0_027Myosin_